MAGSAQTHKSISLIWIVWSTLYVYLSVNLEQNLLKTHSVEIDRFYTIKHFFIYSQRLKTSLQAKNGSNCHTDSTRSPHFLLVLAHNTIYESSLDRDNLNFHIVKKRIPIKKGDVFLTKQHTHCTSSQCAY